MTQEGLSKESYQRRHEKAQRRHASIPFQQRGIRGPFGAFASAGVLRHGCWERISLERLKFHLDSESKNYCALHSATYVPVILNHGLDQDRWCHVQ